MQELKNVAAWGNESLWDSGRVEVSSSVSQSYNGNALLAEKTYRWCVKLWFVSDRQPNSEVESVWPKATVMMKTYLEDTGLFKVDVYRSKYVWRGETELEYLKLYNSPRQQLVKDPKADPDFVPNFDNYDLIVSNFGYRATYWPKATQKAFEGYMD